MIVDTKYITLYRDAPLALESGATLSPVTVAYETYGTLNHDRSNAILICHALTGSCHAAFYNDASEKYAGWWDGLIGNGIESGKAFDTEKYFVLCSSVLGGCYGTSGPTSLDPDTEKKTGLSFPRVSIRDMVEVQARLATELGIDQFLAVAGGSMGGFQVLEWAAMFPSRVRSIIPVSTGLSHSAWAIAHSHAQREAIMCDPLWRQGAYEVQPHGLKVARQMAMISYRSPESFTEKFSRALSDDGSRFQVETYLTYQGEKLSARFDANTYIRLTEAMDGHDLARGRGSMAEACERITAKTLSIGTESDKLYIAAEQKEIARLIANAEYLDIPSQFGHDAFLIEYDFLNRHISEFLRTL
ncbi:MAG: homoserine O-acetyltransferase [Rhizobacter sp.]|nr:homoserine O-acetyltransferase [Chlorobiales bacterium]